MGDDGVSTGYGTVIYSEVSSRKLGGIIFPIAERSRARGELN